MNFNFGAKQMLPALALLLISATAKAQTVFPAPTFDAHAYMVNNPVSDAKLYPRRTNQLNFAVPNSSNSFIGPIRREVSWGRFTVTIGRRYRGPNMTGGMNSSSLYDLHNGAPYRRGGAKFYLTF